MNPVKHSRGDDTGKYLDMMFTDESVDIIMMEFHIAPDLERNKAYQWLEEQGLFCYNCFYA